MSERRLLSVKEASRMLGISIHTLYSWASQRRIPFVKCGRRTEFDVKDLEEWIEKNKTRQREF
jgi:excisionase family DNA binding protein